MLEDLSYINVRDLLESTGISNISESSGEISFSCPSSEHFHGDTSPSARMNSRTTLGICHSCGQRWNAITFLAWHKSLSETVARRLLEERYGGGGISAGVGTLEQEVKRIMNPVVVEEEKRLPPAESWLEEFKIDWLNKNWCQHCSASPQYALDQPCSGCSEPPAYKKYMYDRGFNSDTLKRWEIGYDKLSERITIPIRDHNGVLVGFKGRSYKENTIPKYMILGDYNENQNRYGFQPYKKSQYIFGLDEFRYNTICYDVIIVEGELNVLAMTQHGYPDTVGIAGSEFSSEQARLINRYCKQAIIYLDNDKAGNKGTKKAVEMICAYMPIKVVQNAPGDAADLDKQTVSELINSAEPYLVLQAAGKL